MELAEREKQAVAEVGRQLDQIQNCYHFHSKLCDNSFESEKRKIWENERERGIHRLKKWLDFWPILFLEYGIFLFFQIPFFGRWIFLFFDLCLCFSGFRFDVLGMVREGGRGFGMVRQLRPLWISFQNIEFKFHRHNQIHHRCPQDLLQKLNIKIYNFCFCFVKDLNSIINLTIRNKTY